MCDEKLKMNGESVRIWQEVVAADWRADISYCSSTRLEKLRRATAIPRLEPVPLQSLPLLQCLYRRRNVLKVIGYCTCQIKFSSDYSYMKPTYARL